MHQTHRSLSRSVLAAILALSGANADELTQPDCSALAAWADTVDAKDRWEPFAENTRVWLPKAMASPDFEALFGRPALAWTQADVVAARGAWNGCIQAAKRARDKALQTSLSLSRQYLTGNLRNALRYRDRRAPEPERRQAQETQTTGPDRGQADRRAARPAATDVSGQAAQARQIDAAVSQLVALPPSVESLQALGLLSALDADDRAAIDGLQREIRSLGGHPAARPTQQILGALRAGGAGAYPQTARPRIDARLAEVKPALLSVLREEFAQNPADLAQRRALADRYESVMARLESVLSDEEWRGLADETREKRRAVVAQALDQAKAEIDQIPAGGRAIARIEQIVQTTTARGLDGRQRRELTRHARARQQALADARLRQAAADELPAIPETWAGFAALDALNQRLATETGNRASREATTAFLAALHARLAEVGRKALPEFREQLAAIAEDEAGLAEAGEKVTQVKEWEVMAADVRGDYLAAAEQREQRIRAAVETARSERRAAAERDRRQAIAAGGDPRLVGYTWIDSNNTMKLEFRDEQTVFMNMLGIKAAGSYRVSRDDVVIEARHGQLAFTLKDDRLIGNGSVFERQPL
jgi:hypothetical protein